MLGWRGASRYYSEGYREGFALECRALRRARATLGLSNIVAMIPFCRTPEEGDRVLAEMARHGLERGRNGLQIFVMCEIPSNVVLAENEAVTGTIAALLAKAKASGTKTGICGQAPSTYPEFARFLVAHGIDSISVTPDSFLAVKRAVARAEAA